MVKEKIRRFFAGGLILVLLSTVCAGCGQEEVSAQPEDVELVEPAGVAANYEAAARRNLYDAKVYSALVCPHVEEYALEDSMAFEGYDAFPGQAVKKGSILLHADTENIEKQIENMEESIQEADEAYQEFCVDTNEALKQPKENKKLNQDVVENLEREKPEQFRVNPTTGEVTNEQTDAYIEWEKQYKKFDGLYRSASQTVMELEEALRQKTELYNLDRAYSLTQLEYLKKDKKKGTLVSEMGGYVAAMKLMYQGDWMASKTPLVAVGDMDTLELKCDYVNKSMVNKAADIYAIVNGKRYEVEYQPIDTDEYKRLEELNGKVYSTFTIQADTTEVEMGSYAVIVIVNQFRENVVTVPVDAVKRDETSSYVYLVDGKENIYTPVQTGLSDGVYTEVLSGVNEGDKVLTEHALTVGNSTVKVEKGKVSNEFSDSGILYYPMAEYVTNPVTYGTCYYTECLVSLNQQVKKGEVLARIRVVPDEIELSRKEQKLQREKERLADLKAMGEEENKKAIAAKEKSISELEELIGEMKADFGITEIKAPMNGIITGIREYDTESLLSKDATMFEISDETVSYIIVEDKNGQLTYGNQASISYKDSEGKNKTATGKVVTLNQMSISKDLLAEAYMSYGRDKSTVALIMVSPEDVGDMAGSSQGREGWWSRSRFSISVQIRSMENVLLVPKKAVTEVAGSTYVKVKLEDGKIQYRSFVAGGADTVNYWVVDGLMEGMELCLE